MTKCHQLGVFEQKKFIVLILEAGSKTKKNQGVSRAMLPLDAAQRIFPCLFLASEAARQPWACLGSQLHPHDLSSQGILPTYLCPCVRL